MDIFCMFGAPFILQSDNGHELANKIIQNFADMWPEMKLVHGKPRHSQSQGSVERSNQDVWDMLVAWMSDNNMKTWSEGLGLSKARKTELCIQASRQALTRLCLERRRGSDFGILRSLNRNWRKREHLFNAGMNNGWDKEDKEEANQQDRKDEDENKTIDTSEETVEKKDNKNFTLWFVRRRHQALTSVQCVTSLFMLFVEVTVKTVRVSDWKSLATSV